MGALSIEEVEVVVEREPRSSAAPTGAAFYIWITDEDNIDHLVVAEPVESNDEQ